MRLALIAVLVLAALPAAAFGDDASLRQAWNSEDARIASLSGQTAAAVKAANRSGLRRTGSLLRLLRRSELVTRALEARVRGEQASSPAGARAREAALVSLASYRDSLRLTIAAVRAATAKRMRTARTLSRRARERERLAHAGGRDAERWFDEAERPSRREGDAQPAKPSPADAKPAPSPPSPQQPPSSPPQQPPANEPPPSEDPIGKLLEIPPAG